MKTKTNVAIKTKHPDSNNIIHSVDLLLTKVLDYMREKKITLHGPKFKGTANYFTGLIGTLSRRFCCIVGKIMAKRSTFTPTQNAARKSPKQKR